MIRKERAIKELEKLEVSVIRFHDQAAVRAEHFRSVDAESEADQVHQAIEVLTKEK